MMKKHWIQKEYKIYIDMQFTFSYRHSIFRAA